MQADSGQTERVVSGLTVDARHALRREGLPASRGGASAGITGACVGDVGANGEPSIRVAPERRLVTWRHPGDDARHQPTCDPESCRAEDRRGEVLLAEDEDDLCEVIAGVLSEDGYGVVIATDTVRALDALVPGRFDVVVSDLVMPGGGGRQVLAMTYELSEPLPVILITGWLDEAIAQELLGLGASACLRKPLDMGELLSTMDDVLGTVEAWCGQHKDVAGAATACEA